MHFEISANLLTLLSDNKYNPLSSPERGAWVDLRHKGYCRANRKGINAYRQPVSS